MLHMLPPAEQAKLQAQSQVPDRYTVHPVVAEYLLAQMAPAERQALHHWAAVYYGNPFVEIARNHIAQSGETWTDERIELLARDRNGVVGQMVARTDDMDAARGAMARALAWQGHLFAAGEVDAAGQIVNAVHDILARWGERDRAKGLLRRSIDSREGFTQAVAQGNLATLLQEEGKLAEALGIHQELYETFAALDAKQQMAAALAEMSSVYIRMGEIEIAIEKQEAALKIRQEIKDEEGQAISLHHLAILYCMKEDYETALAHSQAAEALFRKVDIQAHVAATLHEQGIIYNKMARVAESDEEREGYRETAVSRFQDSLAIKRHIGNDAGAADTLGELGKLLQDAGQMNEAIDAFDDALATYRSVGDPVKAGIVLEFLGGVHEQQGQYAAALAKYQEALVLKQQYGSPQNIAIAQNHIARVQAKLGGG